MNQGARSARAAMAIVVLVLGAGSCELTRRVRPDSYSGMALPGMADRCGTIDDDGDADGLDDACELALARAFAPLLVAARGDCGWIGTRLAGGYLFAVQRTSADAFTIAYLPAYFRDCGWAGLPCVTRGRACGAHAGDSELIAVQVRYDETSTRWRTAALFLSAHCFGRSGGRCRWYAGDELAHFTWLGGTQYSAPHVWVAMGKHANYPSAKECDSGHWYYDSCDGNDVGYRFPIVSGGQNIGSRQRPLPARDSRPGCISAEELALQVAGADSGTVECFWDRRARFGGWQRVTSGGATAYARVLAVAGF